MDYEFLLKIVSSILAPLVTYMLKQAIENGTITKKENRLLDNLMFHYNVYTYYSQIKNDVDKWSSKKVSKPIIASIALASLLLISMYNFRINHNRAAMEHNIFRDIPWCNFKILSLFSNSTIMTPSYTHSVTFSSIIIPLILSYLLGLSLMILFHKVPLTITWNWASKLREDIIQSSVNGIFLNFTVSTLFFVMYFIVVVDVINIVNSWLQILILSFLVFIFTYSLVVFAINVITVSVRLLWKIRVSKFANDLPHIIVRTKNGDIFFGQLYDPLDDKLLILRNAKIVTHNGSNISGVIDEVIAQSIPKFRRENYISIPWDDIETLQIVEDGLYRPP